jgi:hypothetical protein
MLSNYFFNHDFPSSFHGNNSAAQLLVAITANNSAGSAFNPSSRLNLDELRAGLPEGASRPAGQSG